MNSDALAERRERAALVAAAYAENPHVAGVLLAGSVARGLADDLSDIEVDVFWHVPPTEADRRQPLDDNSWALVATEVDEHEWADSFLVEGIKVDTSQFLVSTIDEWIDKVVQDGDTEPEYQVRITAIRQGRPLHGIGLVETWRGRTEPYPDVLRRAMVEEGLDLRPRARLEMLATRDDVLMLHSDLVDNLRGILDVLMGLNRTYAPHPWHKWLDWETGMLVVAPARLNERIRLMLRAEPRPAVDEVTALAHETFSLVDLHFPEFDTTDSRAAFEERRVVPDREHRIE